MNPGRASWVDSRGEFDRTLLCLLGLAQAQRETRETSSTTSAFFIVAFKIAVRFLSCTYEPYKLRNVPEN